MLNYTPKEVDDTVNVARDNPISQLLKLVSACLVMVVTIYLVLGLVVDWMVPYIPADVETNMVADAYDKPGYDVKKEKHLQTLLDQLAQEESNSRFDYQLHLHKSDQFNAISLPGGHIMLYSGLADTVQSDDEFAFVLAHELGHYHHRDHLRGLGRKLFLAVLPALLLGEDNTINGMISGSALLTDLQFSRTQELQADAYALELLHRADIPLEGSIHFLKYLDDPNYANFLSTHPSSSTRIEAIKSKIAVYEQ